MAMLEPRPWQQPRATTRLVREINNPIDRLAAVRAEKAKLEKEERELTEVVRKLGDGEHDGDKVRAVITTTDVDRLDVKAIKAAMPDEWVAKFTKTTPTTTVSVKPLV